MKYRLKKNAITVIISSILIFIAVLILSIDRPVKITEHAPYSYEVDLYGEKRSLTARIAHQVLRLSRKPSGAKDLAAYREHIEEKIKKNVYDPGKKAIRYCDLESMKLEGVPVYSLTPRHSGNNRAIIYFHGGAYMSGPYIEQWRMLNQIANATGCKIYLVRYTLGTEAPYPAGLNDALTVYKTLLKDYNSKELILMGDSAGGGMVYSLAQRIRDAGINKPGKLIAISPWLNLATDHPDISLFAVKDPMLHLSDIHLAAKTYAAGNDMKDPLLSPVHVNFEGLPPSLLLIGSYDLLFPDCIVFRARAEAAGYDLTFIKAKKLFHVWPGGIGYFREARSGLRQIVDYIIHYPIPSTI
ncbi:MAG: alpha/beta hydrolase [Bacteroidetes bacterium]|nr:alpha/beta hydrolase [Bacteroidota bacterium]